MNNILENEQLRIEATEQGAELKSIFDKNKKTEYLWQAGEKWWPRNAPILFPIVGKLNDNHYKFKGKELTLPQHGFARDKKFVIESSSTNRIVYLLKEDEETFNNYPFKFELRVVYTLEQNQLKVTYQVHNPSNEAIYFSIGAHPGFICPINETENFEDYYLEFEKHETLDRHLLSGGVFNGETERVMTGTKLLNLNEELFLKDAIVFKNMKSSFMILRSKRSDYSLKFSFTDFPYFGIWKKPGAPFICLEPWCGVADNINSKGNLIEKEGIELLNPEETFFRTYAIEI